MMSVNLFGNSVHRNENTCQSTQRQTFLGYNAAPPDAFIRTPHFGDSLTKEDKRAAVLVGASLAALSAAALTTTILVFDDDSTSMQQEQQSAPMPAVDELESLGLVRGMQVLVPKSMTDAQRGACIKAVQAWDIPEGESVKPGDQFECGNGKGGKVRITVVAQQTEN
jgi:hypothetical protein